MKGAEGNHYSRQRWAAVGPTAAILTLLLLSSMVTAQSDTPTVTGANAAGPGEWITLDMEGFDRDLINITLDQNGENRTISWTLDKNNNGTSGTDEERYADYHGRDDVAELWRSGEDMSLRFLVYECFGENITIEVNGSYDGNRTTAVHEIEVDDLAQPIIFFMDDKGEQVTSIGRGSELKVYIIGFNGTGNLTFDGVVGESHALNAGPLTVFDTDAPSYSGSYRVTFELDQGGSSYGSSNLTSWSVSLQVTYGGGGGAKGLDDESVSTGSICLPVSMVLIIVAGAIIAITMYSRVSTQPFSNPKRVIIYDQIKNNPGIHFSAIGQTLSMRNSTLEHHLKVLTESNMVRQHMDGIYKRYYTYDEPIDPRTVFLTGTQERLVGAISVAPGLSVKELSEKVGLPVQTVSSNLQRLYQQGVIRMERDGKVKRCYLVEEIEKEL